MDTEKQLEIPNMKGLVAAFEVGKKSQDPKLVRTEYTNPIKNGTCCRFLAATQYKMALAAVF